MKFTVKIPIYILIAFGGLLPMNSKSTTLTFQQGTNGYWETQDTHYVDINNPSPHPPYTTWATAANDIQSAIDTAGNGDIVFVADGTYNITSHIFCDKSLMIQSMNGPESTTVNANGNCRVFRLKASNGPCFLDGFTITGGYADYNGSVGGGIAANDSGRIKISNCIIENNEAVKAGGGIHFGPTAGMNTSAIIENCTVRNNQASTAGGGINFGLANGSTNSVQIKDCIVENNKAGMHGGGIHATMWKNRMGFITIEDCIVSRNECTGQGGGIRCLSYDGFVSVSRCHISYNQGGQGGGVMLGTETMISDSLIYGNEAVSDSGGGIRRGGPGGGPVINCTVVSNTSAIAAGGVHSPGVFNSIVRDNSAPIYPDIMSETVVAYSCSPNLITGLNGNISADPQFINPAANDYRLLATSACIDAGTNAFVLPDMDLDRHPRIIDGDLDGDASVDMGAYEFQCIKVSIDIKPGSESNPINLNSKGRIPVAVLTTEDFNAQDTDPTTIRFAGTTPVQTAYEDIDIDGDTDLLLHFLVPELQLTETSNQAYLIGQLKNGQFLMGVDPIKIVPENK